MKITFQLCIAMIFLCQACSKDSTLEEKNWDAYNPITTRSITPHTNPYIDWEDTTLINISGHRTVTLPWYNGASGAIPTYITQDYKRADGWELVYNFCSDTIENDGRKNYLIFYNKLTGKLRVFYYNRDIVTDGSATIAQFITSDPTRLFHFNEGYFSSPLNMGNSFCEVQTSNISSSETKATTLGWNCFEIELAYDPYIGDQHLSISFFDQNIAKILLSGALEAKTDGTIISASVSNPLKPLVNLVGNTAGHAIQNAYEKGVRNKKTGGNTRSKFGELLGSVGSNMVSSGLNLLFGSFLGKFDQTSEQRSTVELKTKGTIQFTGNIQKNVASAIPSIQNLLLPGAEPAPNDQLIPLYNHPLGAWNIVSPPIIELDDMLTPLIYPVPVPSYVPNSKDFIAFCVDYYRGHFAHPFGKEDVIINPETMACIRDYDVQVDYFVISKVEDEYMLSDAGNYNQYLVRCA